ncbi:hypothetical protein BGZ58_003380 [Dissophora ornata]|nr:hypothetical protein BGZ58_003380 [Dissophora ornata]
MLLMLVQGRMQYYKDGARKNVALQLEDENDDEGEYVYDDMDEDCLRHEDSIIEEEQEEEEEEEKGEKDGEEEQEQDDEYRRPRARQTSSQSLDSTKYIKGRVRACRGIDVYFSSAHEWTGISATTLYVPGSDAGHQSSSIDLVFGLANNGHHCLALFPHISSLQFRSKPPLEYEIDNRA